MFWRDAVASVMSRSAKRPKTVNQIVNGAHFRRFYIPEGGPKLSRELQSISNDLAEGLWTVQTSFKDLHYDDGPLESETQVMMQACLQNAAQQIGRQFHVVPVTGMEAISFTLLLRKEYCEDWNLKYAAKFNKTMPKQAKMAVKSDLAVIDRNLVKKTRSRKVRKC